MTNRRKGVAVLALGVSLIALSAVAYADGVEEIVVTAQKRTSKLQETPVAITAFSSASIERNRIEGISDIALRTPGLVFAQTEADTLISLRGVGLNITGLGGEPAVATYQDGVYLGQAFTMSMPAFDLERIEVLRGPQGTLYGRNATGGAINFITKSPQFEPEADFAVSYSSFNHLKLEAGATGSLSDQIAVRGSIVHDNRRDGYRDYIALGEDSGGDKTTSANLAVLFKPTENLSITVRGDYTTRKNGDGIWQILTLAPAPGTFVTPANVGGFFTFPNPALGGASLADIYGLTFPVATTGVSPLLDPDDLEAGGETKNQNKFSVAGTSITVDWDFDGLKLKSISAYRDSKWKALTDEDGTDLQLFNDDRVQGGMAWSQEVNLSGTAFDDRFEWMIGAFYYNENSDSELWVPEADTQLFYEALIGVFGTGAPLPPGSLKTFTAGNPLGQGIAAHQGANLAIPFLDFTMSQESESIAVFGEGKFHVTDNFSVTLGLRWTDDKKDASRSFTSNYVAILAPSSVFIDRRDSASWNEVTGNLVAEYKVNPDTMLYARVARGYKAGGFNIGGTSTFDPEIIWAYEAGLKSRFFDGQVQANSALFYYDYSDIQILRYLSDGTTSTAGVENAAQASILGFEAEFTIAPDALPGFQLSGSVGYLDSQYGHALFGDPFDPAHIVDIDGNALARAPKWKASLAAQYSFETDIGEFMLMADVNYSGSYYFDVFNASLPNQAELKQPSYAIANLRASWTPTEGDYEVQVFVENVTDKLYAETRLGVPSIGAIFGQYSTPRIWGVRLSAKFN